MNVFDLNTANSMDFSQLSLNPPKATSTKGHYFTNLSIHNKPFYIQLPKCKSLSPIESMKSVQFVDCIFPKQELTTTSLSSFLKVFEKTLKQIINDKKDIWFSSNLEEDDIHNLFTPILRPYKNSTLLRTRIYKKNIKFYNENSNEIKPKQIGDYTMSEFIPLIHIEGITFSARSFDVNITITQLLFYTPERKEIKCLINPSLLKAPSTVLKTSEEITETIPKKIENKKEKNVDISGNTLEDNNILPDTSKADTSKASSETDLELGPEVGSSESGSVAGSEEGSEVGSSELGSVANTEEGSEVGSEEGSESGSSELGSEKDRSEADTDYDETGSYISDLSGSYDEEGEETEVESDEEIEKDLVEEDKNPDNLEEVSIDLNKVEETKIVKLKKPNEVIYEIYRTAKNKARNMKQAAIEAYLEAKNIKKRYMLENIDSDSE